MPFALKFCIEVMEMVKDSVVGCLFVQFYDFVKGLFCLLVFTCIEIQHSENILKIQIIHVSPLAIGLCCHKCTRHSGHSHQLDENGDYANQVSLQTHNISNNANIMFYHIKTKNSNT